MAIKELTITDYRGIELLTMHPKALNVISGDNAENKTTVLRAIAEFFDGGHHPNWIRHGAKKATITMVLDDGKVFEKVVRAGSFQLTGKTPDGTPIPAPATYLKAQASGFAFDPLTLITAKPKDRLAYLVKSAGLVFTPEEIRTALGEIPASTIQAPREPVDPDGLAGIRKLVYDTRAGVNKAARDAEGTVATLQGTLPDQDGLDWSAEAEKGRRELAAAEKALAEENAETKDSCAEQEKAIAADFAAQIKALEATRDSHLAELRGQRDKALADIEIEARQVINNLAERATQAQERSQAQARAAGVRESIEKFSAKARENDTLSDRMTASLQALDKLRQEKLSHIPIEGVEPRDGELYFGDTSFDDLSTSEQYLLAFQIAALNPCPLGVMIADRAESIGPKNWPAFVQAAVESGFQVYATRVGPGPLTIETIEQTA